MVDSLLDDVKELMLKDKGDQKVLEQIRRAAENDEVISIHERDYVRKLAEKYLGRKKPTVEINKPEQQQQPTTSTSVTPDVKLPEQQQPPSSTSTSAPTTSSSLSPAQQQPPPSSSKTTTSYQKQKNTKLMLAIGAAALVVLIGVGVGLSGMDFAQNGTTTTTSPTPNPTTTGPKTEFGLTTDLPSYGKGDIISISGTTDPSISNEIDLSIENLEGSTVWSEQVKVKSNGKFSTLIIAGGPGWDNTGDYVLKAEHGGKNESVSFRYNN